MIHSSLVDNDYSGENKLLVSAPFGRVTILQGQRLARALPLPLDTPYLVATSRSHSTRLLRYVLGTGNYREAPNLEAKNQW